MAASNRKIVALIALLLTVCLTAYVIAVIIPTRIAERTYAGARKIGEDIKNAFQFTPTITVENTVVIQQQAAILELATLSQQFQHQYLWRNQWMGSEKKIKISGTLEAKAGFNLNEKFEIDLKEDKAILTLPQPRLLSLQTNPDMTFEDENGIWNWVNTTDRSKAINAFHADARRYAAQAPFLQDARLKLEEQLKKILLAHVHEVEIRYTEQIKPVR